ncbi:MAG: Crossover junction endonuclease mus81 [Sclerophora amabilis]|nr:MAG: Crossover junction endonuclease mus81 [Sclerophora amabilis]
MPKRPHKGEWNVIVYRLDQDYINFLEGQKRQSDGLNIEAPNKRPRKTKPYVPTLRSGPYAILLALSSISEDSSHGFTKAETIELAQPHCDSSFSAPSEPGKFYTAWNSIKTLIEKEYVYERGRPLRKYALTEEGWEVAKRIKGTHPEKNGVPDLDVESRDQDVSGPILSSTAPLRTSSGRTAFGRDRTRMEGSFEGKDVVDGAVDAVFRSRRNRSRDSGRAPYSLYTAEAVTTRFSSASAANPEGHDSTRGRRLGDTMNDPYGTNARISGSRAPAADSEFFILPSTPPRLGTPEKSLESHNDLDSSRGQRENSTATQSRDTCLPEFSPIRVAPHTFTVHLVLDNREVRAKQDRDYFQDELTRRGVKPIMRSLDCGDALWIAKCNDPRHLAGHGEEGDEIVLDWIVERKRLDDLVGSIKDGRFHEQKFRLRKSGVKNVIYIIEEISMTADSFSRYQESVESAIASTQVVSEYFVKKTQKLDDTIRYLARMTALLRTTYESQPLLVIPTHLLTPQNHLSLLSSLTEQHHITYSAFSSLASKSDSLTLRDVFLKMLMCTRGLTGEKALAIQKIWRTPGRFAEAFKSAARSCGVGPGESGDAAAKAKRELVFKQLGSVVGRRKVGRALSAKISEVWGGV